MPVSRPHLGEEAERWSGVEASSRLHRIASALDVPVTAFFNQHDDVPVDDRRDEAEQARLQRAFARIADPDMRRRAIEAVEQLGR